MRLLILFTALFSVSSFAQQVEIPDCGLQVVGVWVGVDGCDGETVTGLNLWIDGGPKLPFIADDKYLLDLPNGGHTLRGNLFLDGSSRYVSQPEFAFILGDTQSYVVEILFTTSDVFEWSVRVNNKATEVLTSFSLDISPALFGSNGLGVKIWERDIAPNGSFMDVGTFSGPISSIVMAHLTFDDGAHTGQTVPVLGTIPPDPPCDCPTIIELTCDLVAKTCVIN